MNLSLLTADTILAIPLSDPERLFLSPDRAKDRYRELMKVWHPDLSKLDRAPAVAAHLSALYRVAEEKIGGDRWRAPFHRVFLCRDGKKRTVRFRKRTEFELGEILITSGLVFFVIGRKYEDLILHGLRMIGSIRYKDAKLRSEVERYMPHVERVFETDDCYVVAIRKTEDVFRLRDLIDSQGGALPPKHTAWVISSLLGLCSFMRIAGRVHNGLTVDSVFVSPQYHTALLLGGWWYAQDAGERFKFLPADVHRVTPRAVLDKKTASHVTDLESVRQIGRVCLGDPSGNNLRLRDDVPKEVASWLILPAPKDPIVDYTNWSHALSGFGPRRFVKLDVPLSAVYPDGELNG